MKAEPACRNTEPLDCPAYCDQADAVHEEAGCEDEFDDLIACLDAEEKICVPASACEPPTIAYVACMEKGCQDDPSKCPSAEGTFGLR